MSEEPLYCFISTTYCNVKCPLYHFDSQQCKIVMAVNRVLGDFDRPQQGQQLPTQKTLKPFPQLESGKYLQSITGKMVDNPVVKEVNTQRGPTPIANFHLTDEKTKVRVALWEKLADEVMRYGAGDIITLTGMSVKDPYEEVIQLSSTRNTNISH